MWDHSENPGENEDFAIVDGTVSERTATSTELLEDVETKKDLSYERNMADNTPHITSTEPNDFTHFASSTDSNEVITVTTSPHEVVTVTTTANVPTTTTNVPTTTTDVPVTTTNVPTTTASVTTVENVPNQPKPTTPRPPTSSSTTTPAPNTVSYDAVDFWGLRFSVFYITNLIPSKINNIHVAFGGERKPLLIKIE